MKAFVDIDGLWFDVMRVEGIGPRPEGGATIVMQSGKEFHFKSDPEKLQKTLFTLIQQADQQSNLPPPTPIRRTPRKKS